MQKNYRYQSNKKVSKKIVLGIFLFVFGLSFAKIQQDSVYLKFNLTWNNELLSLNNTYISKSDTLQLTRLKFYVSAIAIKYTDESTFIQKNSYHLIDIEDANSLIIPVCKKSIKAISKITFCIGIDSLASVSGALSGDLDATKGMYWAWQSGFINIKIEGKSSSCKTRKNEFQFHIGGYLKPNYAIRTVEFLINQDNLITPIALELAINVDLATFFNSIQLSETNAIMIPGKKAMEIATLATKIFTIK